MSTSLKVGFGCGTAVEHTPRNLDVVGSNPAGCWAFLFLLLLLSISSLSLPTFLHHWIVLNQVPQKEIHLLLCVLKEI